MDTRTPITAKTTGTAPLKGPLPTAKPAETPTAGTPAAKLPATTSGAAFAGGADGGAPRAEVKLVDDLGALPEIDFARISRQEITAKVPGATFEGAWTDKELLQLQAAVEAMPAALRPTLEGTKFVLSPKGAKLPGNAMAYARNEPKSIAFQPAGFALPANAQGRPQVQEIMMHEFAHLVDADPMHTQEFAKLSGWKETVYNKAGTITQAPKDANGIDRTGDWAEGNQTYADGSRLEYTADPAARFVDGTEARTGPRDDYAESFRNFVFHPQSMLAQAPEKFLFLNAETRQFTKEQVAQMAAAKGVDLSQVVTNMVVGERAYQPTVDRIAGYHGLSGEKIKTMAADQELLAKSTTMQGLVDALAANMRLDAPATAGADAKKWADKYRAAEKAHAPGTDLNSYRARFTALPLAEQLKTDPQLALGNSWNQYTPDQQKLLKSNEFVQQLVDRAAVKNQGLAPLGGAAGDAGRKDAAFDKVMTAIFDPSYPSYQFRMAFGGLQEKGKPPVKQDPVAALKSINAWDQLPQDQKDFFQDTKNWPKFNQMVRNPDLIDAIYVAKEGSIGYDRLKMALDSSRAEDGRDVGNLFQAYDKTMKSVNDARDGLLKSAGGSMLELAMTEINRQVQSGNTDFVNKFLGKTKAGDTPYYQMSNTMGAWIWDKLSKSEQEVLMNPATRQEIVDGAKSNLSTGKSLAEEARLFNLQTRSLQGAFDKLLAPDGEGYKFRTELKKDPVKALKSRGLWDDLPPAAQQRFSDPAQRAKLVRLVETVQVAVTPLIQKKAGYEKQQANLASYVKNINASNYERLFETMDMPLADMQKAVGGDLEAAKQGKTGNEGGDGAGG